MTKDDILLMAAYSGINTYKGSIEGYEKNLLEFANRIAAKAAAEENEACAKVAEDDDHRVEGRGYYMQGGDARETMRNIAVSIRARHNTQKEQSE